jgi:hypothetical protein
MVLPTDIPTLRAASPIDHAAWHNEIDSIMPGLGLPTVNHNSVNHLAHHAILDELVGVEPLVPTAQFPGHLPTVHKAIHEFVALWDNGISINTGSNVQSTLDANAEGALFIFEPGTYRPPSQEGYAPKANQILVARTTGTILNGSKLLTGWTVAGATWWASAFLPGAANGHGTCRADGENGLCTHRQDVFYDNVMMTRVASQGAVGAGQFFTDYAANRVYIGSDPNGHTVEQAWNNHLVKTTASGVQVLNFTVEKCGNDSQVGAILCNGDNQRVALCDVTKNQGVGIGVGPFIDPETSNSGSHIHGNHVHHNGQMGIAGCGDHHLVQLNEIDNNNTKAYDHGWEAGGLKTGQPSWYDGIIRRNYVHHNGGPGIWQDVAAGPTDVFDNYVEQNITGIMWEISYGIRPAFAPTPGGRTFIRDNVTVHNVWDEFPGPGVEGSYGICNMASKYVEVFGNETYDERAHIVGFQQDRADPIDSRGLHVIEDFHVHDNFSDFNLVDPVWSGKAGLWTDASGTTPADIISSAYRNRWRNNAYRYTDDTIQWFDWSSANPFITFAQFQGFGQDTGGTFTEGSALTPPSPPTLVTGPRHLE